MMTRAELVELLQVERFLPLPPAPRAGMPIETAAEHAHRYAVLMGDTKAEQERRQAELEQAAYGDNDGDPLTKRGLVFVKGDAA